MYGEIATLVHEEVGLTGISYTCSEATEIAEGGLGRLNSQLPVVLFALRGSDPKNDERSWQDHDWAVARV